MFKVVKNEVIIDADVIGAVPALTVLYNRDESEDKALALAKLRIIFHLHDLRSPYAQSSTHNRFTRIVMDMFTENEILMEWYNKHYIPTKVNTAKAKDKRSRKKVEEGTIAPPAEEEEVILKDEQFERAADQYLKFLDLIPEQAMLSAGQDAVHRLAAQIKDPTNKNAHGDLRAMNQAIEDLKKMRELVKVEEERQRSTRGGHSVRKREDPDYLLNKFQLQ